MRNIDVERGVGYDINMSHSATPISVVFAVFEGVQLLDLAGPAEVFALASRMTSGRGYELHFIAPNQTPIRSSTITLLGRGQAETPVDVHTLIVPGGPLQDVDRALEQPGFAEWLSETSGRASRVVSICTGAFLLAAIGMLDGRRAATHWSAVERLARAVPSATVDNEALFVEDGRIWTSAGVSTGIDLALAIVARDLGSELALRVARELVVHLVRPGGQSQFSEPLALQARSSPDLTRLIPWLNEHLHEPVTVEYMACAMGITERSLQRRCSAAFGMSPARLLTELRLERARTLLARGLIPISAVAEQVGFSNAMALAKAFRKRFGASPAEYRVGFANKPAGGAASAVPAATPKGVRGPVLTPRPARGPISDR